MLNKLINDLLIKIINFDLLKCMKISKKINLLIKNNKKFTKIILNKYYKIFNILELNNLFNDKYIFFNKILIVSRFFEDNLSFFEKNELLLYNNINFKIFYWNKDIYLINYNIINFFIIYFNIIYNKYIDKLNIYIVNNNIIFIGNENNLQYSYLKKYKNIKHYLIYKEDKQYILLIKADNILSNNLYIINLIMQKSLII